MTKTVPAIITANSITVTGPDFVPRAIPASHPNFNRIKEALMNGSAWTAIEPLVDLPRAVTNFLKGRVQVVNGVLKFDDRVLDNGLSHKILEFINSKQEGLAEPLIAFLDNVMQNPSMRAVQGLYDWLERSNLPITPDGHILAWKIVRMDYKDIRTGKFDNSIGQVVEQDRNACDEDADRTCSSGLHFCSSGYLPHYGSSNGSRVVVVKIHPRDVVAFPNDYDTAKGRCCRYVVVGEVPRDKAADEFFDGAKVFGGFETAEAPKLTLPLTVGRRVQLRDGRIADVVESNVFTVLGLKVDGRYIASVFTNSGRGNSTIGMDRPYDVVADAEPTAANAFLPLVDGQLVRLRSGQIATVAPAMAGAADIARLKIDGHTVTSVFRSSGSGWVRSVPIPSNKETPNDVMGGLFPLQVGDKVVLRDGRKAVVEKAVAGATARISEGHYIYTDNGRGNLGQECAYDVVGFDVGFALTLNGRYKTRKGAIVTIIGNNPNDKYVFKGSNGLIYTAKGQYLDGVETDNDLVSVA